MVQRARADRRHHVALALLTGLSSILAASVAAAESAEPPEREPLDVDYVAPEGCPGTDAFLREVLGRTERARPANAGELARVLHVRIEPGGAAFVGRLWIEDRAGATSPREVRADSCGEVVSALALVGALAVDPGASTTASVQDAPPSGEAVPPPPQTLGAAPPPEAPRERPGEEPLSGPTRVAVGAGVELTTLAGPVLGARLFVDVDLGPRGALAPAFRAGVSRSFDVTRTVPVGRATLAFTQVSLEGCPVRLTLAAPLSVRPCLGVTGGVLDASPTGPRAAQARVRPWFAGEAHARFTWMPARWVAFELEAGALVPLLRETFYFEPEIVVYRAPPVGFLGRAGLAVHFP
jgi:hypothetical protein